MGRMRSALCQGGWLQPQDTQATCAHGDGVCVGCVCVEVSVRGGGRGVLVVSSSINSNVNPSLAGLHLPSLPPPPDSTPSHMHTHGAPWSPCGRSPPPFPCPCSTRPGGAARLLCHAAVPAARL